MLPLPRMSSWHSAEEQRQIYNFTTHSVTCFPFSIEPFILHSSYHVSMCFLFSFCRFLPLTPALHCDCAANSLPDPCYSGATPILVLTYDKEDLSL
jgi:hypothetical protein